MQKVQPFKSTYQGRSGNYGLLTSKFSILWGRIKSEILPVDRRSNAGRINGNWLWSQVSGQVRTFSSAWNTLSTSRLWCLPLTQWFFFFGVNCFFCRRDAFPMSRRILIIHLFSPELSVLRKKTRCIFCAAYIASDPALNFIFFYFFCFWMKMYEFFNVGILYLIIFRYTWLGFLPTTMNWYARVCFHIQMRSGISLLALSINEFSPLSFLPVNSRLVFLFPSCFIDFFWISSIMLFLYEIKENPTRQQYGKFRSSMAN